MATIQKLKRADSRIPQTSTTVIAATIAKARMWKTIGTPKTCGAPATTCGSLALAVASLGIVNTLVMAILERRREIGILKALGAADRDIRRLFFAEAGVMGLLGGIFGVTLGWLIGTALTFGTNVYLRKRDLPPIDLSSVPWWMVASAIAFSVVVSLAAGIYPASRAAKLNPVEALRYE